MAKQVQRRRDTTANLAGVTPALAEIGYDTDRKGLLVGDGVTAGGIVIPNAQEVQRQSFVYAVGGGTGDAVTIALAKSPGAYGAGLKVKWQQPANNTGAVTLNVNGLGSVALKKSVSVALSADDLIEDGIYEATHDGTNFQLAAGVGISGGMTLLMVKDLTSQAVADFTGVFDGASYLDYLLDGWARPATDGVRPMVQYSIDGGSNYSAGGYSGGLIDLAGVAGTIGTGGDGSLIEGGVNAKLCGNDANDKCNLALWMGPLDAAITSRQMHGHVSWVDSEATGVGHGGAIGRAWSGSTAAVNGLRFKFHSGNIARCVISLFGVAGA